jgi:D-alanine-D-alanine ligase
MGGRSAEREVSLMSGTGVLEALCARGVDAHPFDPANRPLDELRQQAFDRVFIALHGRFGEDGTVQGALELLGIPYTGSGVAASAIAMDKALAKRVWVGLGLPTPGFDVARSAADVESALLRLGAPVAVKPAREGSTIGFTRVDSAAQAAAAWALASRYDADVVCEAFIEGPELTVAILGDGASARALPIIEIVAPGGQYDYQNKYFSDDTRYLCPAPLPAGLADGLAALALNAYRALGCSGWGRVDLMLRARDSSPFLLEVNTSPGMTGHSLVPMAARAAGLDYPDLCLSILASASLKSGATQ